MGQSNVSDLDPKSPPETASGYIDAANALRDMRRFNEADALLNQAAARFPDHEQVAIARAWLANAQRDWPVATARWRDFRMRFPDNPWGLLGIGNALRANGSNAEAKAALEELREGLAGPRYARLSAKVRLRLELDTAKAGGDWPSVRRAAAELVRRVDAPAPNVLLDLAEACWHLGDVEAAQQAAKAALAGNATLVPAILILAWSATDQGDFETALSCYRKLVQLNPTNVRWGLQLVQLLNWLGHVEEALSELKELRRRQPHDLTVRVFMLKYGATQPAVPPGVNERTGDPLIVGPVRAEEDALRQLFDKAPADDALQRAVMVSDPARDVIIAEATGARTAVLVFTGSNDAVAMPLPIFDRWLAALGLTAIYLKDFNRLRFLQGVRSFGDYAATITALRETIRSLGVERVCAIGNCDGGLGAIRYGVELGADRILTFSSPTHNAASSKMEQQGPRTTVEQAKKLVWRRLSECVDAPMLDLQPFLRDRQYHGQIDLFYEEGDQHDCVSALHLDGVPHVMLHPQPGISHHHLLRRFAVSDGFGDMLASFLLMPRDGSGPIRLPPGV